MAAVNIEVTAQVESALKGLGEVTGRAEGLTRANEDAAGAMGVFGVSLTSLNDPLTLVAETVKGAIETTTKYGHQIEVLQRTIGATAEESSKLITATSLVGVSTEDLTRALDGAIKRGHKPTIEGLGQMADKYLSIQDPIARTKFLMDEFGKSGISMAPLMLQGAAGIKALGDEAAVTGNIMSEKDVKAAHDLELGMRSLGEITKGLQLALGEALIPSLVSAAKAAETLLTWDQRLKLAEADHATAVLATAKSYTEYKTELDRAAAAAGYVVDGTKLVKITYDEFAGVHRQTIQDTYELSAAQYEASKSAQNAAAAQDLTTISAAQAGAAMAVNTGHSLEARDAANQLRDALAGAALATAATATALAATQTAEQNAALASEGLSQSLMHVSNANLASTAIADLTKSLQAGLISVPDYNKATQEIGLKYGLMTQHGLAASTTMQMLHALMDSGKIKPEQYAAALDKVKTATAAGVVPSLQDLGIHLERHNSSVDLVAGANKRWADSLHVTKSSINETSATLHDKWEGAMPAAIAATDHNTSSLGVFQQALDLTKTYFQDLNVRGIMPIVQNGMPSLDQVLGRYATKTTPEVTSALNDTVTAFGKFGANLDNTRIQNIFPINNALQDTYNKLFALDGKTVNITVKTTYVTAGVPNTTGQP